MIYYTDFHPDHLLRLEVQTEQEEEAILAISMPERTALAQGYAFTAWKGATCLGMAGISEVWPGRAAAWALVSKHAGRNFVALTKRTCRALEAHPANRIEATVKPGFAPAMRWMEILGFEYEACMRKYAPDGSDLLLYARVRG